MCRVSASGGVVITIGPEAGTSVPMWFNSDASSSSEKQGWPVVLGMM